MSSSSFSSSLSQSSTCSCFQDPEGILGPPQGGHIARLEFKRRLEKDADVRDAFNRQVREEQERRRVRREVSLSPISSSISPARHLSLIYFIPRNLHLLLGAGGAGDKRGTGGVFSGHRSSGAWVRDREVDALVSCFRNHSFYHFSRRKGNAMN